MMRTKPHRTLTPLALEVLKFLQLRPMHPYEMQQLVRDHYIDFVVKVRAGSLYHAVERLHRLGLIEPLETGRAGRRPERTVYAITDTGRDVYRANLTELLRQPEEEFPVFAAAVEMMRTLEREEVLRMLDWRCLALEAELAAMEQAMAGVAKRQLPRMATIEVEFVQAMRRAELGWVREVIEDIRSGELPWLATPDLTCEAKEHAP